MSNPHDESSPVPDTAAGVSRRRALGIAGLGAAAIGGLGYAGRSAVAETDTGGGAGRGESAPRGLPVDFHGEHQAGIATPVQDRLHFATFDVLTESRGELTTLLRNWTRAAERMCAGTEAVDLGAFPSVTEYPP